MALQKIEMEELKDIVYEILCSFADFCEENHLRYYLFGGTLLGAVRHGDFIPWDDDIDVCMPRPDYERFIELTKASPWENYEVKQYVQTFIKMIDKRTVFLERLVKEQLRKESVFIDIFPIDVAADDFAERKRHFKKIAALLKVLVYRICDYRLQFSEAKNKTKFRKMIMMVFSAIVSVIPYRSIQKWINDIAKVYKYEESRKISVSVWGWGEKDVLDREQSEKGIKMKFRDREFWCQGCYVESLTKKYGDYMQVPPPEKRPPFHGKVYWIEK